MPAFNERYHPTINSIPSTFHNNHKATLIHQHLKKEGLYNNGSEPLKLGTLTVLLTMSLCWVIMRAVKMGGHSLVRKENTGSSLQVTITI